MNALSAGSRGEAFWFDVAPAIRRKSAIMRAASVGKQANGTGRDFRATAHESGHVLMNDGGHVVGDKTNLMAGGGPVDPDTVNAPKRLTAAQANDARTDANTAVLRTHR